MSSLRFHVIYFLSFATLFVQIICHSPKKQAALFIFGDSLFDAGNNNYINTSTDLQANFWPYGETFFKYPTGRFSDGRSITDFIAEYAKLPLILPYLHPANNLYTYGVNFASGGAGALVETRQGLVIDLKTQVSYFKKVERVLREKLGDEEAKSLLSRAVYLISIGSNDYIAPLTNTNSTIFQSYTKGDYVNMVIGNFTTVVKEIYKKGGRKFGYVSLSPLGCFPGLKATEPKGKGECNEELNELLRLHNEKVAKALHDLQTQHKGFKYSNVKIYSSVADRINNPSKYGFKEGKSACCGTGPYRGINSCGGKRGVKEYELCENPSQYLFFDSFHPSESANQQFAKLLWDGDLSSVSPLNLKALFAD